jgi:hypothetical protein
MRPSRAYRFRNAGRAFIAGASRARTGHSSAVFTPPARGPDPGTAPAHPSRGGPARATAV